MRRVLHILILVGLIIGYRSSQVEAQYSYSETPLLQVLEELNRESNYILLYRESMLHGKTISLTADDKDVFKALQIELRRMGLNMVIDDSIRQVVIFRNDESVSASDISIQGYIMDAESGERLPYATLSWTEEAKITGIAANESGYFSFTLPGDTDLLEIQSSYIGYESRVMRFTPAELKEMDELSVRLVPVMTYSHEVVVTGLRQFSESNAIQKAVEITQGSILGEENTLKALQQLPSVSVGPALSEGLNVRGSPRDGFQVLLDGVSMYNQTHLFGLFDNFNADALQTSGLYYGITPAKYQAPAGGTLALITRTGSVNEYRAQAGFSNTSLNATLEGPILKGRASFLLSGRTSFVDQINWLGNDDLVRWGLDVDRPADYIMPDNVSLRTDLVQPLSSYAVFGDMHAKVNIEAESGARFMLSGYYGYDDLRVDAERLFRSFSSEEGSRVEYQPVSSKNKWKNGKLSGHFQHRTGDHLFNETTIGWSVFNTLFSKDDFTYTQINTGTGSLESFTSGIEIKSILNEITVSQSLDWISGKTNISTGLSYHYYSGEYFEDSFERPAYFRGGNAHKLDFWLHSEFPALSILNLSGGLRTHFYSLGKYFDLSPRMDMEIFPEYDLSFGFGYSRNYQYVNRISFSNVQSSDVWILVDEKQPPSYADNITAGIYYERERLLLQLEGYWKKYQHLRLHEIETYSVTNAFGSSPWFSDNSGWGRGLELMLINAYERFELNQSVTLSRMELQNAGINKGKSFLADWNRTWQYSGALSIRWFGGLKSTLVQVYGTGTPNKFAEYNGQEKEELGDYYRTDLRLIWFREVNSAELEVSLSLFNVFDISNPWYRDFSFGIDESAGSQRFVSVPVEVYDLGFQPSFSFSVKL